ncbi:ABC transporter substrate-binding protein [Paenibacillus sp. 481]|uniref:ABC transporter substrate-binding protein n=1 Tax=Paenibacillus sp. 481 TaxID=2835869 RepID=UPI001E2A30C2|nr:ABC transporter substrate-binding protein [Paenibacillus sp. 481]UHA73411.1 SgrR family transcriptional regulator [Paenibacillus sp. 481]
MYLYLLELARHFPHEVEVETGVEELAALFHCSTRYTKTILKQLHQQGDVHWTSFQGRGKKPRLLLKKSQAEIIHRYFHSLLKKGDFPKAFQLISEHGLFQDEEIKCLIEDAYGLQHIVQDKKPLDVFRYPHPDTRLVLDPVYTISRHDAHFVEQLFETLFKFDIHSQQPAPNLARAIDSEDGITWRILLRKGVRFHDGSRVTSKDVMATLKRAEKVYNTFIPFERMLIEDDFTLVVQLKKCSYVFPRLLCSPKLSIVPYQWIEKGEKGIPPGTGAFRLASISDTFVKLEAFEQYFGYRPWLDQVEVIHTPSLLTFGLTTSVSAAPNDAATKIEQIEQGADYILLNGNESSVFHDVNARQWLYDAISSEAFCLWEKGEFVATSFVPNREERPLSKRSVRPKPDIPWSTIRILVQQIRPGVNHLREAEVLERLLLSHGLQCSIQLVSYEDRHREIGDSYDSFDCFVGGIALRNDVIVSALMMLQAKENYFMLSLPEQDQEYVSSLLNKLHREPFDEKKVQLLFEEVESFFTGRAILKFLTHRRHALYVSEHSPFYNIQIDAHGKIDYRSIVKRYD